MQRADDVRVIIEPGLLYRRSHPCARSQVCDRIYFFTMKHSSHRVALAKIDVTNAYVFCETSNVRMLNPRIVKIIKIVQDNYFMPDSEQLLDKMRADKAGAACDQDSHGGKLATDEK